MKRFKYFAWSQFPKAIRVPFQDEDDNEDDLMEVKFVEIVDVWRAIAASLEDVSNWGAVKM